MKQKNAFNVIYEFATKKRFHSCIKILTSTFLFLLFRLQIFYESFAYLLKMQSLKKIKCFRLSAIVGKVKIIKLDRQKLKENIRNQNQK